ncbi:MAG: nuclear transport factor 2 family protein [Bacteroidetes bacterium]|nr:nuclear transport factor 2 family protein [Bacteroidota bacterium]
MEPIQTKLSNLNELILTGKLLDAFEMYYDDNVVMQENEMSPTVGKDANRKRENEFLNNITEFRNAEVLHTTVSGDKSFVVWKFDYTHKDWGVRDYTQVSVQHWNDGKIVKEQFIYGN